MSGYNFTEELRRALMHAREESARLHHEYVGTEHILLSLTRDQASLPVEVLQNLNVDPTQVRRNLEQILKRGSADVSAQDELPYTSRAKKVLELAMNEARDLGHDYVGTEHLLVAVLREEKGIGAQVMAQSGLTLDALRAEVLRRPFADRHVRHVESSDAPRLVPMPRRRLRISAALSNVSFALGAVWAVAGAMKLIFGIAISFPLLPPFGLQNIDVVKSLIVGVVLFGIGALLRRSRMW